MDTFAHGPARLEIEQHREQLYLRLSGDWVVATIGAVDSRLRALNKLTAREMIIDLSQVGRVDTAGAFVVDRTREQAEVDGIAVRVVGAGADFAALLRSIQENEEFCEVEPPPVNGLLLALDRVGETVYGIYRQCITLVGLTGYVLFAIGRAILNPRRFRLVAIISHMERTGLDAVPIVSLLTFLIGAVVAFLGARTLQTFGAEIFVVELVAIGVLRELGVLLAAIITAGRSGSAFTAEIGSMKANEEIDAMRTLGIDPIEVLVVPRVIAFVFMLPILAFIGNVMGIFGGMLVSWAVLDVSPGVFFSRMVELVPLDHFWVGLIKAPFFAWGVALIGCQEGLAVEGSAESVGRRTTRSVVQAIFNVIVLDALFAMLFLEINF